MNLHDLVVLCISCGWIWYIIPIMKYVLIKKRAVQLCYKSYTITFTIYIVSEVCYLEGPDTFHHTYTVLAWIIIDTLHQHKLYSLGNIILNMVYIYWLKDCPILLHVHCNLLQQQVSSGFSSFPFYPSVRNNCTSECPIASAFLAALVVMPIHMGYNMYYRN